MTNKTVTTEDGLTRAEVLGVPCPFCGAKVMRRCFTTGKPSMFINGFHKQREKAAADLATPEKQSWPTPGQSPFDAPVPPSPYLADDPPHAAIGCFPPVEDARVVTPVQLLAAARMVVSRKPDTMIFEYGNVSFEVSLKDSTLLITAPTAIMVMPRDATSVHIGLVSK